MRGRASAFPGPVIDLSVGAPTDPTPGVVRRALAEAADWPGYPLTVGRPGLREAYVGWLERVHGVTGLAPAASLPVPGTKELIGSLALHLEVGPSDVVALPELAYPTYAVGAALVGADVAIVDDADQLAALPRAPRIVWVNSPSNPTGRVTDVAGLRRLVAVARERGTLLVSDECYLDLGWDAVPHSVLHPEVSDGDHGGLLAVHSLSKRSNLAGYRCGFVAGDAGLVAELTSVRRNLGLGMAGPQQTAAIAALDDEAHVEEQRGRYAARREVLRTAFLEAGFRVDHGEAGLYLWVTRDEPAEVTVDWLADRGIVCVSGREYGDAGARHVRLALTGADELVALVPERLR